MNPEEVKALQQKLQSQGLYAGPIDGVLGPKTQEAAAQARQVEQRQADRQATTQQAEAEARAAEARAREAEQDATNRLTKLGTEVGPYAVGGTAGYIMSRGLKKKFDAADQAQSDSVSRIAKNRGISPQFAEDQVNRLMRGRNVRTVKQFGVPAAFLGGSEFTREMIAPQFEDPKTREAINLVATGEQGAGITLGAKQLYDMATRGSPIDPEDEALIRSRANPAAPPPPVQSQPRRPALPPAQPQSEGPIRHSERLKQTAAAAGIKPGKSKSANVAAIKRGLTSENMPAVAESLNLPREAGRPQILQRLREVSRVGGKMLLPFAAGALAYDAATSDAEASGGSATGSDTADGLVAGGAAAGTVIGANRLLKAIPAVAGTALAAGGVMAMPNEIANAMDVAPENLNMARNKAARYLPEAFQSGYVDEARQMAQVPDRGERGLVGRRDMNAANLQIPENMSQDAEAPPDFDQYLADLQAIFQEMDAGQRPQTAQRPMPAPPQAYAPQQNRLLQPSGY